MWRKLQHDEPDDYVIATGESHSVREFLEIAGEFAGVDWIRPTRGNRSAVLPTEGPSRPGLEALGEFRHTRRDDDEARPRPRPAGRRAQQGRPSERCSWSQAWMTVSMLAMRGSAS